MQFSNANINKFLSVIAGAIALIIIAVTIVAALFGKRPGANFRRTGSSPVSKIATPRTKSENLREFKEFGAIRALTKADKNAERALLVVKPWLSYEECGSAFYEELVAKKMLFSSIILNFFSSRTKADIALEGEKKIKERLLLLINEELHLGKLCAIYFDDYIFLDWE